MSKIFALLSLLVLASVSQSFAAGSFATSCAWAPNDPDVCAAKRACLPNPRNGRCAKYCNVNPRDVVCGDVYQPRLPREYPGYETPYGWARNGGSFCRQNPWNHVCQHNFPWN